MGYDKVLNKFTAVIINKNTFLTQACFRGAVSWEVMAEVSKDSPINEGVFEHAEESDTVVAVEWTDLSSSSGSPSSSIKSSAVMLD